MNIVDKTDLADRLHDVANHLDHIAVHLVENSKNACLIRQLFDTTDKLHLYASSLTEEENK